MFLTTALYAALAALIILALAANVVRLRLRHGARHTARPRRKRATAHLSDQ